MAQRGGSVTSHVRIGGEAYSPMIPLGGADMLLAFEPGEAVIRSATSRCTIVTIFVTGKFFSSNVNKICVVM